jgi:membrane protease YdiL (CAAX protease family)
MSAQRWTALFLLSVGYSVALLYGQLSVPVVVTLALLVMAWTCVNQFSHPAVRTFGHLLFIALSAGLASHWLPGFFSARVIAGERLSPEASPYSMYLHLDKPLIGVWIALACPWVFIVFNPRRWAVATAITLPVTAALCLNAAVVMGMVGWSPKWPEQAGIWAVNNLLLVSLTEELLFRGYIQGGLQRCFRRLPYHDAVAILLASALFGMAHVGAGWEWALLAGMAGLGYGVAYRLGGLPAAVLTHFGLNLLHFSLLTYPMFDR